jgi:transposase
VIQTPELGGSNHALRTHRWGVGCHQADAAEQAAWRSSGAPDRRTQNRDLPTAFGPYTACYNRFVGWRRAGIWGRIIETLATAHDAAVQMIDTLHPPKSNRSDPICFSPYLYRARNQVERFFNRITMSSGGDALRQARRQLPRPRPTRFYQAMAEVSWR